MHDLKISVVIRNKNESKALEFLLSVLDRFYREEIHEVIVLDNLSQDSSQGVSANFNAKFITIEKFSYGGSANMAMECSTGDLVVIMSAHSYPVSHDFFQVIKDKFGKQSNLAGVRCIHYNGDYKKYLNGVTCDQDLNGCGLTFACSVVKRSVWENTKFIDDIQQCEDKEWSKRVLKLGYLIEFAPAIYCYEIKRSSGQLFTRFKNDVIINYQLWGENITYSGVIRKFFGTTYQVVKYFFTELYYNLKRTLWLFSFLRNKPIKKY